MSSNILSKMVKCLFPSIIYYQFRSEGLILACCLIVGFFLVDANTVFAGELSKYLPFFLEINTL